MTNGIAGNRFSGSGTADGDVSLPELPQLPGRPRGVTEVAGTFRVTHYDGLEHGRSGTHEVVDGVLSVRRAAHPEVIDTLNVHVAMNVRSAQDPHGLPRELPLAVGQVVEVEGEYIPARLAHARNQEGAAAVLHFTHAPGGFVVVAGTLYRLSLHAPSSEGTGASSRIRAPLAGWVKTTVSAWRR